MDKKNRGEILHSLINMKGLTLKDFADEMQMNVLEVGEWCIGKKCIHIEDIPLISMKLNIPSEDLIKKLEL